MTLTKQMDWEWLLNEARRQWAAGNSAGVRHFCNQHAEDIPVDILRKFVKLLASEPKAKPANRPREQPEDAPGAITIDHFCVPDNDLPRHVATLQRMGDESAARELFVQLGQARATGDKAFLREHGLHNKTDKAFPALAREYVEGRYRVRLE